MFNNNNDRLYHKVNAFVTKRVPGYRVETKKSINMIEIWISKDYMSWEEKHKIESAVANYLNCPAEMVKVIA